jgi:hypothetical protein
MIVPINGRTRRRAEQNAMMLNLGSLGAPFQTPEQMAAAQALAAQVGGTLVPQTLEPGIAPAYWLVLPSGAVLDAGNIMQGIAGSTVPAATVVAISEYWALQQGATTAQPEFTGAPSDGPSRLVPAVGSPAIVPAGAALVRIAPAAAAPALTISPAATPAAVQPGVVTALQEALSPLAPITQPVKAVVSQVPWWGWLILVAVVVWAWSKKG